MPVEVCSNRIHLIKPNNWGYSSSTEGAYVTDDISKTKLVKGVTDAGYEFLTTRYRTRRETNPNMIVMSPIKKNVTEAYIEYTFTTTIDRMDFEMSCWRTFNQEKIGVNSDYQHSIKVQYAKVEFDETNTNRPDRCYYTNYYDIKDMYKNETLSENKEMKIYTVTFDNPVNRVRFYTNISKERKTSDNLGRICIGNIYVYDSYNTNVQKYMEPSGYEIPYNPQIWNETEHEGNCYAYAFNMTDLNNPTPSPINSYNIDHTMIENYFSDSKVITTCVELDANRYGFYFKKLDNKTDPVAPGHYKVALTLDDGADYHWYRQNPDGTWSHKAGGDCVSNGDYDGNFIIDPENLNYKGTLFYGRTSGYIYDHFVGYFEVSPMQTRYEFDRYNLRDDTLWYLDEEDGLITSRNLIHGREEKIYPVND